MHSWFKPGNDLLLTKSQKLSNYVTATTTLKRHFKKKNMCIMVTMHTQEMHLRQ
jgi:hypothetical protein